MKPEEKKLFDDMQKELKGLQDWKLSLEKSLSIPRNIENAFKKRLIKTIYASASLNFTNTLSQTSNSLTLPVVGAKLGDIVALGVPHASTLSGGVYTAWVSAADTVTINFANATGGALDPAIGVFTVAVMKND